MKQFPLRTKFRIRIDYGQGLEEEVWIVDSHSDVSQSTISADSPLGQSLLRATCKFSNPAGDEIVYEILRVTIGAIEGSVNEIQRFLRAVEDLLGFTVHAQVPQPVLNQQDIHLAIMWADTDFADLGDSSAEMLSLENLTQKYGRNWELGRVLSARAAEKAVMQFYERHGYSVQDVSIEQINPNGTLDWQDYDLLINGHLPVDVKNSREARRNKKSYVDHCVPAFKSSRVNNRQVEIVGVLSPYLWPTDLLNNAHGSLSNVNVMVLGRTSRQVLDSIQQEFSRLGFLDIEFSNPAMGPAHFLPPWIFDYPNSAYGERDRALSGLAKHSLLGENILSALGLNTKPVLVATGQGFPPSGSPVEDWVSSFVHQIERWRTRVGFSLPFLYLSVLTHFLNMVSEGAPYSYEPRKYREILYFRGDQRDLPLLIYDPLETVWNLISVLGIMWTAEHDLIRRYKLFKLENFNIIKGREDAKDSQWKTLVAYCGGWIDGKGPCGETPLVLGTSRHCPECGRLVCPNCGFCSRTCSVCRDRQSLFLHRSQVAGARL